MSTFRRKLLGMQQDVYYAKFTLRYSNTGSNKYDSTTNCLGFVLTFCGGKGILNYESNPIKYDAYANIKITEKSTNRIICDIDRTFVKGYGAILNFLIFKSTTESTSRDVIANSANGSVKEHTITLKRILIEDLYEVEFTLWCSNTMTTIRDTSSLYVNNTKYAFVSFSNFSHDVSEAAKTTKTYTCKCLDSIQIERPCQIISGEEALLFKKRRGVKVNMALFTIA